MKTLKELIKDKDLSKNVAVELLDDQNKNIGTYMFADMDLSEVDFNKECEFLKEFWVSEGRGDTKIMSYKYDDKTLINIS